MNLSPDAVLLFGSGISIWQPSDIPSGRHVSDQLLTFLFGSSLMAEWQREGLSEWLQWIPFETINQFAPSSVPLRSFYSKMLDVSHPNALHQLIAAIANGGAVKALITTNYDRGIEMAAGGHSCVEPVTDPEAAISPVAVPLFKIHGCTSAPETLVYKLDQEAILDAKKEVLLQKLLRGRTLHVLGYSGVDFELCPAIARSEAKAVIWYHRDGESETPGFQMVAASIPTIREVVDLRKGTPWAEAPRLLSLNATQNSIQDGLSALITDEDRIIWSVRLATSIGFAAFAIDVIDKGTSCGSTRLREELREQQGFALFQAGRYETAAKTFIQVARVSRRNGQRKDCLHTLLDASDALRSGGFYFRALKVWLWVWILSHLCGFSHDVALASRLVLKLALLLKVFSLHTKMQRLIPLAARKRLVDSICRAGSGLVGRCYQLSTIAGRVFDQKQLVELMSFFGSTGDHPELVADGYGHLGYLSASSTLFRVRELHAPLTLEQLAEAEKRYTLMARIGNSPEAWKIALRLAKLTVGSQRQIWKHRADDLSRTLEYTSHHYRELSRWVKSGAPRPNEYTL